VEIPPRDGDGYLLDMNQWTPEIGRAMAEADGLKLDDEMWEQILKAREYYEEYGVVPPIRKFAKYIGANQKDLFRKWMTGPMKPITKYGGGWPGALGVRPRWMHAVRQGLEPVYFAFRGSGNFQLPSRIDLPGRYSRTM